MSLSSVRQMIGKSGRYEVVSVWPCRLNVSMPPCREMVGATDTQRKFQPQLRFCSATIVQPVSSPAAFASCRHRCWQPVTIADRLPVSCTLPHITNHMCGLVITVCPSTSFRDTASPTLEDDLRSSKIRTNRAGRSD